MKVGTDDSKRSSQQSRELIGILTAEQRPDGSFLTDTASAGHQFETGAVRHLTTFTQALIVGALAAVPGKEVKRVRERAAKFLLAQRGPEWSFNYWTREAPERKSRPYPDDWDDTSCAVIALTLAQPEVVTGEVLGHVVALLTNTELQEGGPYRTWLVPESAPEHWQDVDVAVNANIAYMLRLHGVDLPNLNQMADEAIAGDRVQSPYYPSAYPIEYFLSRWYRGAQQKRLLERVLARQKDGLWHGPLDTALAVSTCLNLGEKPATVASAVAWLRALREDEVLPGPLWLDQIVEGQAVVAGSRVLTAAFCLEAIAKYDEAVHIKATKGRASSTATTLAEQADRIHQQVVVRAMARFEEGGDEIQAAAIQMRDRLLNGAAASQITLLPNLFRWSLGENGRNISDERVVELGMISFYGWVAYTVYDDFLDDEGRPPLLPMANMAMREMVLSLREEAARTRGFGAVAWATLDRQEAANAWEVSHARVQRQSELRRVQPPQFADLHVLAERSMGHALGCLALTMELGYGANSKEMQAMRAFFHHFLIARQLSDDAHDWKADLQLGQINAVGAHLLSSVGKRETSVRALYSQLEQHLWKDVIGEINGWIFRELSQAREALAGADFIQRPEGLEALLAPIEESAKKTQEQQLEISKFLRTYHPE